MATKPAEDRSTCTGEPKGGRRHHQVEGEQPLGHHEARENICHCCRIVMGDGCRRIHRRPFHQSFFCDEPLPAFCRISASHTDRSGRWDVYLPALSHPNHRFCRTGVGDTRKAIYIDHLNIERNPHPLSADAIVEHVFLEQWDVQTGELGVVDIEHRVDHLFHDTRYLVIRQYPD